MLHVIKLGQENFYKTNKKTPQFYLLNQNLNVCFKFKRPLEEEGLDLHGHSAAGMVTLKSPATVSFSSCADTTHNGKVEYSRETSEYDFYSPPKIKYN